MEGAAKDACSRPDFQEYDAYDTVFVVPPSQSVCAAMFLEQRFGQMGLAPARKQLLMDILEEAYVQLQPKRQDRDSRLIVIQLVTKFLSHNIPGSCISTLGSFVMDLFTSSSDLDFSINFADGRCLGSHNDKVHCLEEVAKALHGLRKSQPQSVQNIVTIYPATVPILKFVDCKTGIECDISVGNEDGVLKSQVLGMLVSTMDSRFRQLCYLVKGWAQKHNLNSPKNGTLNSLSICLLVAFHLQTRSPAILPPFSVFMKGAHLRSTTSYLQTVQSRLMGYKARGFGKNNTESIPELFTSFFFKLLAMENLWGQGLFSSTYKGRWIYKIWPNNRFGCISVEDFVDRTQNVARSVSWKQFDNIYEVLQCTVSNLKDPVNDILAAEHLTSYLFGSWEMSSGWSQPWSQPSYGPRYEQRTNFLSPAIPSASLQNSKEQHYRHNQRGPRHHHSGYRGWDSTYRNNAFLTSTAVPTDAGYSGGDQYRHSEADFPPIGAASRDQYPQVSSTRSYRELVDPPETTYAARASRSRTHHGTPSPTIPSGFHQIQTEQRYRHNYLGWMHHHPGSDKRGQP